MTQPTSFRLDRALLDRLAREAESASTSVTALVASLLEEGLNTRRFPGIVYRDGPTGRRAGLAAGPDVWEIVRAVRETPGAGERRVRRLASELEIPVEGVRLAVDFYAEHADEIDARIAAAEVAEREERQLVARRERLMSS